MSRQNYELRSVTFVFMHACRIKGANNIPFVPFVVRIKYAVRQLGYVTMATVLMRSSQIKGANNALK